MPPRPAPPWQEKRGDVEEQRSGSGWFVLASPPRPARDAAPRPAPGARGGSPAPPPRPHARRGNSGGAGGRVRGPPRPHAAVHARGVRRADRRDDGPRRRVDGGVRGVPGGPPPAARGGRPGECARARARLRRRVVGARGGRRVGGGAARGRGRPDGARARPPPPRPAPGRGGRGGRDVAHGARPVPRRRVGARGAERGRRRRPARRRARRRAGECGRDGRARGRRRGRVRRRGRRLVDGAPTGRGRGGVGRGLARPRRGARAALRPVSGVLSAGRVPQRVGDARAGVRARRVLRRGRRRPVRGRVRGARAPARARDRLGRTGVLPARRRGPVDGRPPRPHAHDGARAVDGRGVPVPRGARRRADAVRVRVRGGVGRGRPLRPADRAVGPARVGRPAPDVGVRRAGAAARRARS